MKGVIALLGCNFACPHVNLHERGFDSYQQFQKKWSPKTPGMAAGITYHIWTFRELVTVKCC